MIGRRSHDDAQSFEEAWNGRAPRDEHIADLVRFAEALCESAVVEPSTTFRSSLRDQLMAEAATALVPMPSDTATRPVPTPARRNHRRRAATVTAALIASAGTVGLVGSSASALPGEMLYPVKRGMENVQLSLHRDDASRGEFQLARASERLAEAQMLAVGDSSDQREVADLLTDFTTTASDAWVSMDDAFKADPSSATMQTVNDFAQSAAVDLTTLRSALPEDASPSFGDATDVLVAMTSGVAERCPSCDEIDLGLLVSAVTDLAGQILVPAPAQEPTTEATGKNVAPTTGTRTPVQTPAPKAPETSTPPASTIPTVPVKTPPLSKLTDPLIDGLLGDDDQVGLIPGLLGGILGTPPKP